MDKIFNQAKDKNVAVIKVYAKSGDAYVYSDAKTEKKIDSEDLQDMFIKGMIVISGDNTYAPVCLNVDDGVAKITCVAADSSAPTTAVLATLASSEYTAV